MLIEKFFLPVIHIPPSFELSELSELSELLEPSGS